MIANNKNKDEMEENLEIFLDKYTVEFVDWLRHEIELLRNPDKVKSTMDPPAHFSQPVLASSKESARSILALKPETINSTDDAMETEEFEISSNENTFDEEVNTNQMPTVTPQSAAKPIGLPILGIDLMLPNCSKPASISATPSRRVIRLTNDEGESIGKSTAFETASSQSNHRQQPYAHTTVPSVRAPHSSKGRGRTINHASNMIGRALKRVTDDNLRLKRTKDDRETFVNRKRELGQTFVANKSLIVKAIEDANDSTEGIERVKPIVIKKRADPENKVQPRKVIVIQKNPNQPEPRKTLDSNDLRYLLLKKVETRKFVEKAVEKHDIEQQIGSSLYRSFISGRLPEVAHRLPSHISTDLILQPPAATLKSTISTTQPMHSNGDTAPTTAVTSSVDLSIIRCK